MDKLSGINLVRSVIEERLLRELGKHNDTRSREQILVDEAKLESEYAKYKEENPELPQLIIYLPKVNGKLKTIFKLPDGASKESILTSGTNEALLLISLSKNLNKPFNSAKLGGFLRKTRAGVDFTNAKRRAQDTITSLRRKFGPEIIAKTPNGFVFNSKVLIVQKFPH